MKKALLIIGSFFLVIALTACGSASEKSGVSSVKNDTATVATSGKDQPNVTFKNGVYKTKKYILTINKEQVVKDKQQGDAGLIVWYTIKNIGKDSNVTGSDSIANLTFSQSDGSSMSDLQDGFDAESALYPSDSQVDQYNQMLKVEKKADNKVLPGKTVKTFDAYELDNTSHNVIVKASDPKTMDKVPGKMTIKIK